MFIFRNSFVVAITCAGLTPVIFAQNTDKPTNPHEFATTGEGKTLPERVMRARFIYGSTTSNGSSYDKDGAKKSSPVDVKATGGAIVAEYGLSEMLSLQFRQDFVTSYEVSANRSSDAYGSIKEGVFFGATGAKNATELGQGIAAAIAANATSRAAFCGAVTAAECTAAILAGTAKNNTGAAQNVANPRDSSKVLFSIPNGAPLKTVIDTYASAVDAQVSAAVDNGMKSSGGKGLGDTTVGILAALVQQEQYEVSLGAGIRYPTGNRDRGIGETKVGRGLTEIGTRLNVDVLPVDTMLVSWQNTSEVMLASGTYKEIGEKVTVKRNGVRNVGFLVAKPSLAGLHPTLSVLGPKLGVAYDYDSEEVLKYGSNEEAPKAARSAQVSWTAGMSFNFFEVGAPLQLDIDYNKSFQGKNVLAASDSLVTQLKAFYRF